MENKFAISGTGTLRDPWMYDSNASFDAGYAMCMDRQKDTGMPSANRKCWHGLTEEAKVRAQVVRSKVETEWMPALNAEVRKRLAAIEG